MIHSISQTSKPTASKVSQTDHIITNKELDSSIANTDEDDDEDMINYKPQKKKRSRLLTNSSSPEPTLKKNSKKAYQNPNRKDKAGRTKIFSATTAGHLDKVKELVDCGADVNFKDNAGWTPLHEAALKGQYEIAEYLISCGAEVNVRGFGLDTPLHDACNSNSPECVQLLVDAGADVFALNEAEKRPIDLCSDTNCQRIVQIKMKQLDQLLARDKNGRSSLHRACLANKLEKARSLIEQGADVHAKDNEDATPLHLACACGHVNIVKLLIDQDAIINILGTIQMDTPLHEASRHGHQEIVSLLINAGADVNMEDKAGKNPYHVSAAFPTIRQILTARMDEVRLEKEACNALDEIASKTALRNEPVRQLTREERKIQNYLRAFANMDSGKQHQQQHQQQQQLDEYTGPITLPKRRRRTISHRKSLSVESDASSSKKINVVKLDASKKDSSGRTQLHKYAKRGDVGSVENLLELGADANEKDYAGWTALHEAALNGHLKVVKVLLKYGADVNSKGADLDTPLHDATENNHCDIVELLLERGADPFARNVHDAEPIDIATEHEFQDIILVLQAANPVVKKKRNKKVPVKKEDFSTDKRPMTDVQTNTTSNNERLAKPQTKKRRLIQAADLEKSLASLTDKEDESESEDIPILRRRRPKHSRNSDSEYVEIKKEPELHLRHEKENIVKPTAKRYLPSKKNLYNISTVSSVTQQDIKTDHQPHSPIHTPPPETWTKERESCYSPLYTVQVNQQPPVYYVVDLQVSLFLGLSLEEFWSSYSYLTVKRKPINTDCKARLWSTLNSMVHQDKSHFVERPLYFISFDDVADIIKRDFSQLSSKVLTIALDIGYSDEQQQQQQQQDQPKKKHCSLPPKIAMKMKKCGYKFQQYTTPTP